MLRPAARGRMAASAPSSAAVSSVTPGAKLGCIELQAGVHRAAGWGA